MYVSKTLLTACLLATTALTDARSINMRQTTAPSAACDTARQQIVNAVTKTQKTVAKIQDPTVRAAAASGIAQAQAGISTVAQAIVAGQAPPAAGRVTVEAGLNATGAALMGGSTNDEAVSGAKASLAKANTAAVAVVANC